MTRERAGRDRAPRRWLGNLGLALASTLLCLGVLEGGARLAGFRPERPPQLQIRWTGERGEVWRFEPGARWRTLVGNHPARANALGFRDREVGPKPAGGFRILVLGDSVTFGHGQPIRATFARRLEARLGPAHPGLQVLNAGIPGWSTYQQRRFYEEDGEPLGADVVLVAFVLNDAPEIELGTAELRLRAGFWLARAFARAARHSALLGAVKRAAGDPHDEPVSHVLELVHRPDSPRVERAMDRVCDELDALQALTAERGARLGLLLFPFRFQLTDPSLDAPQARLRRHAAERALPVLDLLPLLARHPPDRVLMDQDHLTAFGHSLVAEAIAAWLADEGLLRAPPPGPRA